MKIVLMAKICLFFFSIRLAGICWGPVASTVVATLFIRIYHTFFGYVGILETFHPSGAYVLQDHMKHPAKCKLQTWSVNSELERPHWKL